MNLLILFLLLAAPAATDIAQRLARWKPVAGSAGARVLLTADVPKVFTAPLLADSSGNALSNAYFQISQASFCGLPKGADTTEKLDKVTLRPRSVEGIFQFLGGIARA